MALALAVSKVDHQQLPKYLKRPFAIMRLFHEAARVAFQDLASAVSKLQKDTSMKNLHEFESMFHDFMRAVAIHKEHEAKGLFPALSASIQTRMAHKNYTPSLEVLANGLAEIPSFVEEHKEDHETVAKMETLLKTLKESLSAKEVDADSVKATSDELYETVTGWITFHEEHLQHEEAVMSPLMKGIATTLHMKVAIARTLLMVNRESTINHQFGFVLNKLLRVKEWFCPMTKHTFQGNELLLVYINCFRMMIRNKKEYTAIVNVAKQILSKDQWKQVVHYGLDIVK